MIRGMNKRSQVSIFCKIEAKHTLHLKTYASSPRMFRLNHT